MRTLLLLSFLALASSSVIAQVPTATPTPGDDVVKISTNLIQVDVTVTDDKGNAITNLRPDEIEIYENGQKQKLTSFSFVSGALRAATPAAAPSPAKGDVPLPPRPVSAGQVRRTFALVVDDLSLSFESAYYTRRALKKFVDEQMQDGDLVAIIRTGAGIGALQQFTSDKRLLYAAIEKVKWNPAGTGGTSVFAPIDSSNDISQLPDQTSEPTQAAADNAEASAIAANKSLDDFRASVFASGTLGALRYVVEGMDDLPGRKSVILFSDGFKLFETDAEGHEESGRVLDFVKQLVDAANRSSVVFYAIDPRGLQYTGLTAADSPRNPTGQALSGIMSDRSKQLHDTQDGLRYLADETGGFAVVNSNDLSGGVSRVLKDQSYYLVGYEPDADTFDPSKLKYNKLEVKVLRPGAHVRYRSGFFNVAEKERPAISPTLSPAAQLETALVSPFAVNGIDLHLNALFGDDAASGAYVKSLLHVNAGDLKFTDAPNGGKKAVFDVLAMSFGDNGQVVDRLGKAYTLTVKPDAYARMAKDGFVYSFAFPVKKAGAYQYRVALRDEQSGKVGSAAQFIEVPDLKKKRLTLSSIVIENVSQAEWNSAPGSAVASQATVLSDTALRRVKVGSVLRYGYEIYNARTAAGKPPNLETRVRVFQDGKLVLDGRSKPFDLSDQKDLVHLKAGSALSIGGKLPAGDYVLQVIVTDLNAPAKQQVATQFVQFEAVP